MSEAVGVLVDLLIDTIQARLWLDHELRGLVHAAYKIEEEFKEKNRTMRNAPTCASDSVGKRSTNQEARLQRIAEVLDDIAGAASDEVVRKMESAGLMRALRESNVEQATLAQGELDSVNPGQDSAGILERFNRRLPEGVGTMLDLSLEEEYYETGERPEEDLSESTDAEGKDRGTRGGTSVWDDRVGHFLETLRSMQNLEDLEKVQEEVERMASSLAAQDSGRSTLEACKEELLELSIQDFLLCMKERNIDALAFINVVYRHMSSL
uniref:Uncharacterized protein n=1 Tax=Picocystis salinarum TaxID=88271 RepID=A0A7S3XEH2_9CHLO